MKKQASDQQFHERRYQERKRAEAARRAVPKKKSATSHQESGNAGQDVPKERS